MALNQAQIQALINEIITDADYTATKFRPLLSELLAFAASAGSGTTVYDGVDHAGLVANSTTLAGTTSVCSYGVNVFKTVTALHYATKLPPAETSKIVGVVNLSQMPLYVYPSMVGGQINNQPLNTPGIVPPDGKLYQFLCIENPLPGAWTWSPPAISQWDSGEVNIETTEDDTYITFIDPLNRGEVASAGATSAHNYDGINRPPVSVFTMSGALPNNAYLPMFKPVVPWNAITKIKVYTNLIHRVNAWDPQPNPTFLIKQSSGTNTYATGTTTPPINVGSSLDPTSTGDFITTFPLSNRVAGSGPITPGIAENLGDPYTSWGEKIGVWGNPSFIGDKFLSSDGTYDYWFTRYIGLFIKPNYEGFIKFRTFIEYY